MKTTKKNLWLCAVSMMLCVAMLLGTTFAWFTDSVTNKGNVIQAGELDAVFGYRGLTSNDDYSNVEEMTGTLFNDMKWEPGKSFGYDFKVTNAGSLAFDWELSFQNIKSDGGSNDVNLADVLDVYVLENVEDTELSGTPTTLSALSNGVVTSGQLTAKDESKEFSVVIKMKDTAGNDYQNASITFNVYLRAKQATVEEDGFGFNDYDEDAKYSVTVSDNDPDAVIDAANTLKDGESLILNTDVTLPSGTSPRKTIRFDAPITATMDFGGHVVTGYNGNISLVATNGSNITLTNGTLTAENGTYCTIGADKGNITVDGLTLKNTTANGNSVKVWANSVVNLNNVTSTSVLGGAIEVTGGEVNVNGGTFTQTGYYNWNSGIGAVSYNGVLNIYDMTAISENYCLYTFNSGGTINVYDGNFTATGNNGGTGVVIQIDSSNYASQPSVINIYGGTFDGKIKVGTQNASLNIVSGTFKNTGMTFETFCKYIAEGSSAVNEDGVYVVTKS